MGKEIRKEANHALETQFSQRSPQELVFFQVPFEDLPSGEKTDLISLISAAQELPLSSDTLFWLCQRRNIPLFYPSGEPINKIKKDESFCLRPDDLINISEEISKTPLMVSDVSNLTNVSSNTIQGWARKGLIGTKQKEKWVFARDEIQTIIQLQKLKEEGLSRLDLRMKVIKGEKTIKETKRLQRESLCKYEESTLTRLVENLLEQPDTFGLKEATLFLNQNGIEISYGTLAMWTILILDKAVEENNPQLLSPTALAFRGKNPDSKVYFYQYTVSDLKSVLRCSPVFYQREIPLVEQHQAAKARLKEIRRKNVNLYQVAEDLLGSSDYTKRRRVEKMLLKGTLPLGDYPFLFANTVGIPPKLYESLKSVWQQALRKTLSLKTRLEHARKAEGLHFMIDVFQEIFGLLGVKKKSPNTRYATFYLRKQLERLGIKEVEILVARSLDTNYYCFLEQEGYEALMGSLNRKKLRPVLKKTREILQNGFQTLEEFQEYCPPGFFVSLSESLRFLGISVSNRKIGFHREALRRYFSSLDIEIRKVIVSSSRKTGKKSKACYLNLDDLERLAKLAKETPNFRETLQTLLES